MADLKYTVQVDTKGAQKSMSGLTKAVAGLAAALSVRELGQFSDNLTTLQTKLRSFIPDVDEAEKAFKAVAAISISTGQNLESVGDLFTKVGRNANSMGLSLYDAGQFTQQLSTAFALFGATSQEAERAIYNIGQAFSLTMFQGEDLNSVIETMGPVAQKMAEVMGVETVGELKKLASQGKVTAQVIVDALDRMDKEGILKLEKRVPTLGEAFTSLRTSFALLFAEVDDAGNVSSTFASAIEYIAFQIYNLSNNAKAVIGPLTTVFKIGAALAAFTVVGKIIRGAGAAFAFVGTAASKAYLSLKNFGTTLKVIGGYVARIFGKELKRAPKNTVIDGLAKSAGFAARELKGMAEFIVSLGAGALAFLGVDKLVEDFQSLGDAESDVSKSLEDFREELGKFGDALDDTAGSGEGAAATAVKLANEITLLNLAIKEGTDAYKKRNAEQLKSLNLEKALIGAGEEQATMLRELDSFETAYLERKKQLNDEITKALLSNNAQVRNSAVKLQAELKDLNDNYDDNLKAVKDTTNALLDKQRANVLEQFSIRQQIDLNKQLQDAQNELATMGMTTLEEKYYDLEQAAKASALAAIQAEEARIGRPLNTSEVEAYYEAANKGLEKNKKAATESYEASRLWATGWKEALNDFLENATDNANKAKEVFDTFTKGVEDAFVNFAKTGKLSFKDLLDSMVEMLLRSQIQKLMGTLLSSASGTGIGDFFSKIFGRAQGGPVQGGTPYMVGEKGPELFVPNSSGQITPNNKLGGGGTVNNTYITNSISAVDAKSVAQLFAENRKTLLGTVQMAQKEMPYG
jgi:tape measure domain-containing protein|tara:strand:+ start:2073 stop:4490 length:2418 start_codon:yes stop_codon:yes gene_type:complete